MGISKGVEGKRLVLVEFDQQHRAFIVLEHRLCLSEESSVLERGNQISDGFSLDTDVRGDHVVTYSQHAGDDDHGVTMKERRKGGAELANVNHDARWLGGCSQTATASYSGIYGSKEMLLRVGDRAFVAHRD